MLRPLAWQGWEDVRHAERVDPFTLVKAEIDSVSERLRRGILSGIPVLERAAEYFFKVRRWAPVKQLREQRKLVRVKTNPCAMGSITVWQL